MRYHAAAAGVARRRHEGAGDTARDRREQTQVMETDALVFHVVAHPAHLSELLGTAWYAQARVHTLVEDPRLTQHRRAGVHAERVAAGQLQFAVAVRRVDRGDQRVEEYMPWVVGWTVEPQVHVHAADPWYMHVDIFLVLAARLRATASASRDVRSFTGRRPRQ